MGWNISLVLVLDLFILLLLFNKGRLQKKGPFCSLLLQRGPDPPPLVVPWESEIFLVNIFVVVDAIDLETDFTLETNRKRVKEKLLKRI